MHTYCIQVTRAFQNHKLKCDWLDSSCLQTLLNTAFSARIMCNMEKQIEMNIMWNSTYRKRWLSPWYSLHAFRFAALPKTIKKELSACKISLTIQKWLVFPSDETGQTEIQTQKCHSSEERWARFVSFYGERFLGVSKIHVRRGYIGNMHPVESNAYLHKYWLRCLYLPKIKTLFRLGETINWLIKQMSRSQSWCKTTLGPINYIW